VDLKIEQSCPGCGAEIELHEDDRLLRCPFCEVNNYMLEQGARRFVLPWSLPHGIEEKDLFFLPYLRFKGTILYASSNGFKHKLVDTTRLGVDFPQLPRSLRLRPQAMKVKPIVADMGGRFIGQTIKMETIFSQAVKIVDLFAQKKKNHLYHRAFIGESLSKIYQPCYIRDNRLFDGIDNRPLGPSSLAETFEGKSSPGKTSWEPKFISTICPRCADFLEGEPDSLVLHCRNCETLWQEQGGKFTRLKWSVIASENRAAEYLPFWKITFQTTGKVLKSYGDFLRLTNQPVVVRREHDDHDLCFWFPAFKINPKGFLQAAKQLTLTQLRVPAGEKQRLGEVYPVTLPWKEAFQAIKSLLAVTTLNKRDIYPLLPIIKVSSARYSLRYLPFTVHSHDLVQEHTRLTLTSAALRYGRKL